MGTSFRGLYKQKNIRRKISGWNRYCRWYCVCFQILHSVWCML